MREDICFTIKLPPVTKKNSQQIRYKWAKDATTGRAKKTPYIAPSSAYTQYANEAGWFITGGLRNLNISTPVNIKCVYYMPTKRRVDLSNLINATDDVLVKYRVVEDDNSDIIASHDGSYVVKGDANPRTVITISFLDSSP